MNSSPCIFITGSAKRIGRAIAEYFAERNYRVVVHYNKSEQEAQLLLTQLKQQGHQVKAIQGELDNPSKIDDIFEKARDCFGCIDVLVNSASRFTYDNISTADYSNWQEHLDTNLWAPFRLSQLMSKQFQGDNGNIINIIDQRVQSLTPHFMSYTVSKAGLWTITQTMALALAPKVRVNAIAPGPVIANEMQKPGDFERQYQQTPLQRRVEPIEIAKMIQTIVDTPSMTGQLITIDSGQHLGWSFPPNSAKEDMG